MIKSKDIISFLKDNKATFERDFSISKIGLIGSFSRNEGKENSDIDVIVEFRSGTEELFRLKEGLRKTIQKQFGTRVDICRMKYLKSYYKDRILKDAIFV